MNSKQITDLKSNFDQFYNTFVNREYDDSTKIGKAVKYACLGGGKKVRPLLCMLTSYGLGCDGQQGFLPALALELVHTYSLIHDDLPAMDDDVLRRGQPTLHVKFDEATAILAGDALLTDAFAILVRKQINEIAFNFSDQQRIQFVHYLSTAAGSNGMIKGQVLDLHWTDNDSYLEKDLDEMHKKKTGDLMGAACALGAVTGQASSENVRKFYEFGELVGLAFQITDDILDGMGGTGKSPGKDQKANKLTFLKVMTITAAAHHAKQVTDKAVQLLSEIKGDFTLLQGFVNSLINRAC